MRFLPLARLLRLPNVFTAFADIALGVCVTWGLVGTVDLTHALLLFLASGCLYLAGMVWNDYFDFEEDRRERGFRPLPSGQISKRFAVLLAMVLMLAGVGCSLLVKRESAMIAGCIAFAVLLYDAWLKHTPIGPVSMATCRFLNVLLGLTLADVEAVPWSLRIHLASVIGVYIVGVTWFARTEASMSKRSSLIAAASVIGVALLIGLAVPLNLQSGTSSIVFPYMLVLFVFLIGLPLVGAIQEPIPAKVQRAVKRTILGLVFLDATLATIFVGISGMLVLLLLPPALLLGKWVYST